MCVLGHTFSSAAVYNSALAFISCLSRDSVLARCESLELSWVFSGHAHSPLPKHIPLYPQECQVFKTSMSISFLRSSFWAFKFFWPGSYFPKWYCYPRQLWASHQVSWGKVFSHREAESLEVETNPVNGLFQRAVRQLYCASSLKFLRLFPFPLPLKWRLLLCTAAGCGNEATGSTTELRRGRWE